MMCDRTKTKKRAEKRALLFLVPKASIGKIKDVSNSSCDSCI